MIRARLIPLLVATAAAGALGAAWYVETALGQVPCALCLLERWPYRIAIVLGVLAAVVPRGLAALARGLLMVTLLGGVGLGVTHLGVEQGWWPDPLPECRAPRFQGGTIAERLAAMPAHPAKPCDDPTYLIPGVPLSMAAMDAIFALALALIVAISWPRRRGRA